MSDTATKTITFRQPLTDKGTTYDRLELREPTSGEMTAIDGVSGYTADIKLISAVCAMPESAVKQIPAREFVEAARFLADFLVPDLTTGDEPLLS